MYLKHISATHLTDNGKCAFLGSLNFRHTSNSGGLIVVLFIRYDHLTPGVSIARLFTMRKSFTTLLGPACRDLFAYSIPTVISRQHDMHDKTRSRPVAWLNTTRTNKVFSRHSSVPPGNDSTAIRVYRFRLGKL